MHSITDLLNRPYRGVRKPRRRMHPAERIARNIEIADDGCWLWTASLGNSGYGQYMHQQTGYPVVTLLAHRVSYEIHNGPIPEGLVLDHLCRVPRCVNPDHLEPVRQRENVLRSPIAIGAINAAKTHCAKGHEFTPENTYTYRHSAPRTSTERICKTCRREYVRAYQARKRGSAA